jgi:hypothetical protein
LSGKSDKVKEGGGMNRFGFNIRTRGGHKVDNIVIMARDFEEAERRLRQMYTQCEILNSQETAAEGRRNPIDVDSVIGLISRHTSAHKPGTQ